MRRRKKIQANNLNHSHRFRIGLSHSNLWGSKTKSQSQKKILTGDRVMVVKSWILQRLELTEMVTLERVSQIVKTIHSHKTGKENCTQSDDKLTDLQEKLLQSAQIINKVANRLEDDWQDLSVEESEGWKQLYENLKLLGQTLTVQDAESREDETDAARILCNSLERLMNTLADAIEFECISSEVSNILSVPFTEDEVKKADTAIARLTAEVNSQEYSSEEIWARFDAVRDRITSTTKLQN